MSKESIMTMLKTLCQYKNVSIKHTFSSNDQPLLTVRCINDSNTIEITNLSNNHVSLFNCLKESAEAIHRFIHEYEIV